MQKYTKTKVIRITYLQHQTLQKMKTLNIDVGNFIRQAIKEKLEREKHEILKPKKEYCPF
jgi:post-segregation antitoxin (ccd killing protein)